MFQSTGLRLIQLLPNASLTATASLVCRVSRAVSNMADEAFVSISKPKPVIGVCQLTCTADKEANFHTCLSLIKRAKARGAQMVFLPEACDYIGESKQQSVDLAETLDGETISKYKQVAKETGLWISIGGFHQRGPVEDSSRVFNTHVVITSDGTIQSTYSKTHLFDLDLKGRVRLCESDYTIPGHNIVPPVDTPVGKVGLSTCYDLRFPELSIALTQQGAQLLTYPSAFTMTTGMAHWEVLLRSRAIETQCYVIAAAQTGKHNNKRTSYGHAMVVDPWGSVVAQCQEGTDVCLAEVDLEYLGKIRTEMPVWQHRRYDLYGHIQTHSKEAIDSQEKYQYGQYWVQSPQVFYRSALSIGFVNIKPVLPGHVLVAPIRPAKRLSDLTQPELADLFSSVQQITKVVEKHFECTSATVAVQDGEHAGQTVEHVHVHILPRRPGDLPDNDDIYGELERHDKDMVHGLRSPEAMQTEAAELRPYFV